MDYVSIDKLLKQVGSIYKLTVLGAKRAGELNSGSPKLVDNKTKHAAVQALKEIAAGKVNYKQGNKEDIETAEDKQPQESKEESKEEKKEESESQRVKESESQRVKKSESKKEEKKDKNKKDKKGA